MTGMRMRHRIRRYGPDYPLGWVKPIFQRTSVVMGNLEGPFAKDAKQEERNYSYKVNPNSAAVLRRGGFRAMTLANNHLTDCGRDGVRETLATLARQGIAAIGAGMNQQTAHDPAILDTRGRRIGLLGYYWNQRTAADGNLPGSARDLPELVERDIKQLKPHVDRVAVTVHWGVPYEREPSDENRLKAHHFIDCGADIVIGHHPHIIQPVEIYRERPIIYSIGNFAFGSGNTRAESLLVGVRFLDDQIEVDFFPVCVQNRDPRLDYQPKIMCGEAGMRTLRLLASISGEYGKLLTLDGFYGRLRVVASERNAA
jgi:poly-gamma-glutamate capsule biosynthesis protein CapA/YwtB (metallophosphatase superfamily)